MIASWIFLRIEGHTFRHNRAAWNTSSSVLCWLKNTLFELMFFVLLCFRPIRYHPFALPHAHCQSDAGQHSSVFPSCASLCDCVCVFLFQNDQSSLIFCIALLSGVQKASSWSQKDCDCYQYSWDQVRLSCPAFWQCIFLDINFW